MNNIIDISDRLDTTNRPKIKLAEGHEYVVRNDKVVVFKINEIHKSKDIADLGEKDDKIDELIKTALGEEALKYIREQKYSMNQLTLIVDAIMAQINEVSLEEIEKETEEAKKKADSFRK